jgi:hypothetical protein
MQLRQFGKKAVDGYLEYRAMKTDDKTIFERESYWKEVLLTRGNFGYNKN